jgi:endonuclease/exonuclease/phosphatase family metal-dependent hydrolase
MTFNLRYDNPGDGINAWPQRRDGVVQVVRAFDPDLLGVQEALAAQVDFLHQALPEYTAVGVGRNDGRRAGEFALALFRTTRFDRLEDGHFWLSPTPDTPGKGWDAASIRIVTWVRLRDRTCGATLLWLNTHWDDQGRQARLEGAREIRTWLDSHAGELPVVLTGDFNTTEDTEAFQAVVGGASLRRLLDAYRLVHPMPEPDELTFHNFRGGRSGQRIDFILHTGEFQPMAATIDRSTIAGTNRYPSDHYPVTAVLDWKR